MVKKIVGYIMMLALIVGSVCGIVFGIKYKKSIEQPTNEIIIEYKNKVEKLTSELNIITVEYNKIKNELEILLNDNVKNEEIISNLKIELDNLKIEKDEIQSALDKAVEDYLNSYKENYNKGYQAGYDYGLAVGRGEIDNFVQNYLIENNLTLYKSYLNENIVDSKMDKTYLDTRENIYQLSNIFNYDNEFEKYSLMVATEQGYIILDCKNIEKSNREFEVKVEDTGLQFVKYIVDDYFLTFSDEKGNEVNLSIAYCANAEGNEFNSHVPGLSGGLDVSCNYLNISANLIFQNGIANFYLISSLD